MAVVENRIGPRLLLATHPRRLGYVVTAVSCADALAAQVDPARWIGSSWTKLSRAAEAMLSCAGSRDTGESAHRVARLIAATGPAPDRGWFDKPLDYGEIIASFSARAVGPSGA